MKRRYLTQILAVIATLGAMLALNLAGAPAIAQFVGGFLAGVGAITLYPPEAPAAEAPAPPATTETLPVGVGRHVLERLPTPFIMIDSHGLVMFANPPAQLMFERLRPGEHYGLSFRHPDLLSAIGQAMDTGVRQEFEFNRLGDPSLVLRAHIHGMPQNADITDPGDWPQVICLFEDRTSDRQAEQLRTDFIANASHELRTPLASIRGFIETLQGPAHDDADARDRFLGVMSNQAARMQRLVDDLLSLSRIEMNEHLTPDERLSLGSVVQEVASALAPLAEARITIEAPVPGPTIHGDRHQLSQAIGNLLENALKYGREGAPVRVILRDPTPSHPAMIGICVIDEGEGVAREHIPRLTERFYRVSPKRSRDLGGTGLGLAIVKHIAAHHRGDLEIESELGVGSRFTLWLPVLADEDAAT